MNNFVAFGCGAAIHYGHAARAAAHDIAFFHRMGHQVDGQSLFFGFHDRLAAADVKENFPIGQPVGSLLQVTRQQEIGFAEQCA